MVKTLADRLAKNRGRDSERDKGKCTPRNFSTRCSLCRQKLRPKTFFKNVGDVEVKALVMTMPHSLAEAQVKKPGDTVQDVETDASTKTVVDTLIRVKE